MSDGRLDRLAAALSRLSLAVGAGLLWLMVTFILAQIVGRGLGLSIVGADELATYAMVGLIFVGLAHTHAAHAHIRVELLIGRLPRRWARQADIAAHLTAAGFVAYFTAQAAGLAARSAAAGAMTSGLLPIPLGLVQSLIWIGGAMYLAQLLLGTAMLVRRLAAPLAPHTLTEQEF